MSTPRLPLAALVFAPTLALVSGCDLFAALTETSAIVDVFTASHSTPDEQGELPEREGDQLVFTNDMGWEVFVDEAYVTTTAVTLQACDGERFDIEMYWGAFAENLPETGDLEVQGVGAVRANSGTYCSVLVEYGPFEGGDTPMDNPDAIGTTVYIAGKALKDGVIVPFTWKTSVALEVEVDISEVQQGKPFEIRKTEYVSKKLTVAKTYDRFFDGVDFDALGELGQDDIDSLLADTLTHHTQAFAGASL